MKFELYVVITDPEAFLRGDIRLTLYETIDYLPSDWVVAGKTTIDINPDTQKLTELATQNLAAAIGKATAAINVLEQRKAELLAITDQS